MANEPIAQLADLLDPGKLLLKQLLHVMDEHAVAARARRCSKRGHECLEQLLQDAEFPHKLLSLLIRIAADGQCILCRVAGACAAQNKENEILEQLRIRMA